MCGFMLKKGRKTELRELLGLEQPVSLVIRKAKLRWFGRVDIKMAVIVSISLCQN